MYAVDIFKLIKHFHTFYTNKHVSQNNDSQGTKVKQSLQNTALSDCV